MKRPITGAPTILPGRGYSGLERPTMGLFNTFKTWVKGLPKTITLKDYLTGAAGVTGGTVLGYDNTHNQHIKKGLQKANEAINDQIEWRPFSTERIIENLTNPNNKKTPKFKK